MKLRILASGLTIVLGMAGVGVIDALPGVAQTNELTVEQKKVEADRLLQEGVQQYRVSEFELALRSWQQALILYREIKDQKGEGNVLGNLGTMHYRHGNYPKAIEYYEQRLVVSREIKDRREEGRTLDNLGSVYSLLSNYPKAIEYHEQSLVIVRELKDRLGEGDVLGNLGNAYDGLGNYPKAIEYHEQALIILREFKNPVSEGIVLGNLGSTYGSLGNYPKAIQYYEQNLAIARATKDRFEEGRSLGNLGTAYDGLGNYTKAIEYYEQSLVIKREIKDRQGEGVTTGNLGNSYHELGNYPKAIEYSEQSLAITREIKDRIGEGTALNNLGNTYNRLSNYEKSIEYYKQSLAIKREIKDRQGEGNTIGNLGNSYLLLGNHAKAIEYYEQALAISRSGKNRLSEGAVLGNLGNAYESLSNYPKAIEYYQQSLVIAREIKDRGGEGNAIGHLGNTYQLLGNYSKAIEYYERSLTIKREVRNKFGEGNTIGNLGTVYKELGNYPKAIEYYQQSLTILREIKDRAGEGTVIGNLGNVYNSLHNYPKAIEYHEKRLEIAREIKDRKGEGYAIANLGNIYNSLRNYPKAIEYHEQGLVITREIKDRAGEQKVLHNLGEALENQEPELAIVLYKQSVQIAESIRTENRKLSRDLQNSYTETVAGTYRRLADLLLSQGRVLEAQQVLELLKIQELRDFTKNTRSGPPTPPNLLNKLETRTYDSKIDTIQLGSQLTDCERTKCPTYSKLTTQYAQANTAHRDFLKELRKALKATESQDPALLQNKEFTTNAQNIILANPDRKTLLLYPLVLDDKLWLLWGSQAGKTGVIFDKALVNVSRKDLSTQVEKLRSLLQDKNSNPEEIKKISQQLYQWLITPIRPKLDSNSIQNIVFSLDRATRYIPMAALHDGKQYLIENFNLSTILTANTNTTDKLDPNPTNSPLLGLGVTNAIENFAPLPAVQTELDAINRIYPGLKLLNQNFTETSLRENVTTHRILHIATHGKFITEDPDNSFLLLGDGNRLKIPAIETFNNLAGLHLVVLSACETGKGGLKIDKDSNEGMEVAGMGHYFLQGGAKSVMASLWPVNDPATALLMQQFYKHLATGKSKPEAIRQVQQDFINGKLTTETAIGNRQEILLPTTIASAQKMNPNNFTHPYYWAPFILIGNAQ